MKVLVISHHKEHSGWGRANRDFIKALSTQTDVVIRAVKFEDNYNDDFLISLENKSLENITHIVQYLLPHHMEYYNGYKKVVGISLRETYNIIDMYYQFNDVNWRFYDKKLNLRIPKDMFQAFEYNDTNEVIHVINIPECNGLYKFYFVGEGIKRKNIHGLIRTYYQTFTYEPVALILKTSIPGMNSAQSRQHIEGVIKQIQDSCRLYERPEQYPKIVVITERWSDEQIKALHKHCDCYVNFSYGESICYPMLEAAAYNKPIITTEQHYSKNILNIEPVLTTAVNCYGQNHTFPNYNTSREYWYEPDSHDLSVKMLENYLLNKKTNEYDLSRLSYTNMGKEYVKALEE